MLGVVACEALYPAVERLVPDAAVRYVPPELHEFPANVPDERSLSAAVQARVDALDDPSLDRIAVCYALGGAELRSTHAPLVLSRADDCVSQLLGPGEPTATGEPKAAGTYYLTRGWIDAAVDAYKLYRAYRGEADALLARFEAAAADHPDLRVSWADGEAYARAVAAADRVTAEQAGRSVHEIVGYYDRVALVDAGDLHDVHREYAESFRAFLESLSADHGDGHAVEWAVVEGDLSPLRETLTTGVDRADDRLVEVVAPGGG